MADPLSVSANIAGLITITEACFRRTYKHVKAVKDAPDEASSLAETLGSLSGILHNLELVAAQFEGETFDPAIQVNHVDSCVQTVQKVEEILDKSYTSPDGSQQTDELQELKWPFSVSEVKTLCAEIEQHKTNLSLALYVDGMTDVIQASLRKDDVQKAVHDVRSELQRIRAPRTRNKERRKVLKWIQPYNPRQNHDKSRRLRSPGTGFWLTESDEFRSWLSCSCARLWCYGIPGAGKTVLASLVIEEAFGRSSPNTAVAFFYCDYKDVTTQDPRNILGSLACQFALQDKQSYLKLHASYAKYHPPNRPPIAFDLGELRNLLLEMAANFNDVMIIVDALDECDAQTKLVTRLLSSLSDSNNIKTFFFSRDEQEIRENLEEYNQVSIAAKSSDLRLFVKTELDLRIRKKRLRIKDISLKDNIMKRLVEDADGM